MQTCEAPFLYGLQKFLQSHTAHNFNSNIWVYLPSTYTPMEYNNNNNDNKNNASIVALTKQI